MKLERNIVKIEKEDPELRQINGEEWWKKDLERRKLQSHLRYKVVFKNGCIKIYSSVKELSSDLNITSYVMRRLEDGNEPEHETIKEIHRYVENK